MNTLTANLHMMMCAFYKPDKHRFKIVIEDHAFGSDQYATASQITHHGLAPEDALVRLKPRSGESCLRTEDIIAAIQEDDQAVPPPLPPPLRHSATSGSSQWHGADRAGDAQWDPVLYGPALRHRGTPYQGRAHPVLSAEPYPPPRWAWFPAV
jgi:hypothetical protein